MPDLAARPAIESGLPPLDLLVYQIHIPLPSNGEPSGVVSGSGVLIGAGIVGVGSSRAAWAGAATASSASRATARMVPRRRAGSPARGATWRSTGCAAAFTALSPSHRLRGELTGSR